MATIQRSATDTSGFVPQYWAQRALDVLRNQIVLPQLVARDTNFAESAWKGKSITVPYPGTFTAQDKVEGTVITPQTPSGGQSITLTLNKHKVVGFSIEDFTQAQANVDLMDLYLKPAVIAIAEQFENDAWLTMMGTGSIASEGTPATDLTAAVVRKAMQRLNEAKAPASDRAIVLSPKDQAAILGDSNLSTLLAYSQPSAVYNGFMGKLYGLDIYWSQLAPTLTNGYRVTFGGGNSTFTYGGQTTASQTAAGITAATLQTALAGLSSVGAGKVSVAGPTNGPFSVVFDSSLGGTLTASTATVAAATKNIAFHRNAMMYAVRPFAATPAGSGVYSAQANDPDSGLNIRVSAQYDINAAAMRVNVDLLYGMVVLRSGQGIILDA